LNWIRFGTRSKCRRVHCEKLSPKRCRRLDVSDLTLVRTARSKMDWTPCWSANLFVMSTPKRSTQNGSDVKSTTRKRDDVTVSGAAAISAACGRTAAKKTVRVKLHLCVVSTVTYPLLRYCIRCRFRKNRVRACHSVCRCWAVCAAVARQAQEAGRRVSRAKEWAELQASWLRTERQVRKNRTLSYMNRLTATANLRKRRTLFCT